MQSLPTINPPAFRGNGIRAVLIEGRDGGWGDAAGSSRGLSNAVDLNWMLANRQLAQAILVSFGTGVRERYRKSNKPLVAISADPLRRHAALDWADFAISLDELPQLRVKHGWTHLVCEGGPRLVDELAHRQWLSEFALTTSDQLAQTQISTPSLNEWQLSAKVCFDAKAANLRFRLFASN